ncbi:MAG: hypothetical protein HY331_17980 [Chloroflexi bacterium]|nr:hypothetical protein [Chloroflexota bacterium]
MTMTVLLLILAGAVVLWLVFGRLGAPVVPAAGRILPEAGRAGDGRLSWLRLRRGRSPVAEQLQRWATERSTTPESALAEAVSAETRQFAGWLAGLTEQQQAAFVRQVSTFCRSVGFDLGWLAGPQVADDLKRGTEAIVLHYCLAVWTAHDLAPFVSFNRWQNAPDDRRNQVFVADLYRKVVEAGLAANPPELVLASDRARRGHVRQAIERAAADHAVFADVLRSMARQPGGQEKIGPVRDDGPVKGPSTAPVEARSDRTTARAVTA